MEFKVFVTELYDRQIGLLEKEYRDFSESLFKKLKENPFQGKQLAPFLREKRLKEKRIYYLIYEDLSMVLLVAVSGKKDQQEKINQIKDMSKEYRKTAEEISKQLS